MTYPVECYCGEPDDPDLEALERIAARRAEIEAMRPADGPELELRSLLLGTLDEMEEFLPLRGYRCRVVREGWKTLAGFESFGRNGGPK